MMVPYWLSFSDASFQLCPKNSIGSKRRGESEFAMKRAKHILYDTIPTLVMSMLLAPLQVVESPVVLLYDEAQRMCYTSATHLLCIALGK